MDSFFANFFTKHRLLISQRKISLKRIVILSLGILSVILGVALLYIPWREYMTVLLLTVREGSVCFSFWSKPPALRLIKVYVFNTTNAERFLAFGEKPHLHELGPFVYRQDLEMVNIQFHGNGTVTFQQKKTLHYMPESSMDANLNITVPNFSLLMLTSQSNTFGFFIQRTFSMACKMAKCTTFLTMPVHKYLFGFEDPIADLAFKLFPKKRRNMPISGMMLTRNHSVSLRWTMYTGASGMDKLGLIERLNGSDRLGQWGQSPCNLINASDVNLFPPRYYTHANMVNIYDPGMCRTAPFIYQGSSVKNGIAADLYKISEDMLESGDVEPKNRCFCPKGRFCPPRGLHSASACYFDYPVFMSFPHFYLADKSLLNQFEGLQPDKNLHNSYIKIQPRVGVPLEAKMRLQFSLKLDQSSVYPVQNFTNLIYPVLWLEDGVDHLPPSMQHWVYFGSTFMDVAEPLVSYILIVAGLCTLLITYYKITREKSNSEEVVAVKTDNSISDYKENIKMASEGMEMLTVNDKS